MNKTSYQQDVRDPLGTPVGQWKAWVQDTDTYFT